MIICLFSSITEYVVTETVTNNTGLDWIGYTVQLGFGSGSNFTISSEADGLDFDEEDLTAGSYYQPASTAFAVCLACPLGTDTLIFKGGVLRDGETDTISFHVDVPNWTIAIPENYRTSNGFEFTLRQTPTVVPVPAAFGLMLSALVTMGAGFRRRPGISNGGRARLNVTKAARA